MFFEDSKLLLGNFFKLRESLVHHIGGLDELGLEDDLVGQVHFIKELLNEFSDLFAAQDNDLGLMKNVAHSIDTGTSLPFKSKPYQKSLTEETQVKKELGELLENKIYSTLLLCLFPLI